jgi:glycosyltransferase involved in cell wall biosynthesis
MRVVILTAGTGSFYCGTCIRDNALTSELRRQGHDALLVPLYLPLTLDEPPAAAGTPLFYGGVNVYLQQKLGLFRRTPRWMDRVFDAPALLRMAGARAGMTHPSDLGDLTVSMLLGEHGRQVKELDRLSDWLVDQEPDLVILSNALLLGAARRLKEDLGVPVACMLQGEDTFLDDLPEPQRADAWLALAGCATWVDLFLPVSAYYQAQFCSRLALPPERVHVVHCGISLAGFERVGERQREPVVGYLARMSAIKGLGTLVEAFILLRGRGSVPGVRLRVAGSCTPGDAEFVRKLQRRAAEKQAGDAVEFLPNLDRARKLAFLQSLSVFSVPATYGEAFGLYLLEAMAAGVPVVQPRHGAFPELLEATGGGILCEPDDPMALAEALEQLLLDPARADALGAAGRAAVLDRFSIETMARNTLEAAARSAAGHHKA